MSNNNHKIRIGNKEISKDKPCFIIAEAGVNHNGSLETAKKLVDAAAEAGADAVKFQTFKAELIVTDDADQADYQKKTAQDKSQFAMLKKLELTEENFKDLRDYCLEKRIEFLSTPHSDTWSVDILEKLGMAAYKMGSGDITNIPILKYIARLGKPIIVSTGMATISEINEAKEAIMSVGRDNIIMLHCTTSYPSPEDKVNLRAMTTIRDKVGTLVGYSDHTLGLETPVICACMGPVVYEKHFTLDRKMPGPDHKASLEPADLKRMVQAIRFVEQNRIIDPYEAFRRLNSELGYDLDKGLIETILGTPEKVPTPEEINIAKVARKSVVALADIWEGEAFTPENIGIRRPGEGLAPKHYEDILGKKTVHPIKKNAYVKFEDVQ